MKRKINFRITKKVIILFCLVSSFIIAAAIYSIITKTNDIAIGNVISAEPPCSDQSCDIDKTTLLSEQKTISERLKNENPQTLYLELVSKYAKAFPNTQHAVAHVFGKELYKSVGSIGVSVCDGSFAFGCFHGFFNAAIGKNGPKEVLEIDQMCIKKFGADNIGCQHGIGHGVAEYFGPKKIDQSLQICKSLEWKYKLMGCSGGVFMEYLMPTLGDDNPGSVSVIPLNESNPYEPCNVLDEFYRSECYYNLGLYYSHTTNSHIQSLTLCEDVINSIYKKTCLLGLGNGYFTTNGRDIKKTIEICSKAKDIDSQLTCRAGAAWILFADQLKRSESSKFCENLSDQDRRTCISEINLMQLAKKI